MQGFNYRKENRKLRRLWIMGTKKRLAEYIYNNISAGQCRECGTTIRSKTADAMAGEIQSILEENNGLDAAALAKRFHEIYENLAPNFHYETRKKSAVPWSEVPENNKSLMIATCAALLREVF
jgi:hypothetical protein